ncbi:hypothetical protein K492DRAFT_184823 [Lichtheimia hyalospora FSU 10163]|nr:hypothetical protein K492DRAFT_184823 [Lichtheimia hyalospora FSU 10163]
MTKSKNVNPNFKKIIQINDALKANDISMLKELGRAPGGFLNSDIRCKVWPKLLLSSTVEDGTHGSERSSCCAKENVIFPEESDKNKKQAHGVTTESDEYNRAMMNQNTTTTAAAVTMTDSCPKHQYVILDSTVITGKEEVTQQMALIGMLIQQHQPGKHMTHGQYGITCYGAIRNEHTKYSR